MTKGEDIPPTPCPNMGQILVQGAKVRKHGCAVFGQARFTVRHVPRNTCCRRNTTLPLRDYNRPAYTPEHNSTWNYSYTNTLTPILTFLQPEQSYKPHSILDWNRNDGSKKSRKKCGNTESPSCLDMPV